MNESRLLLAETVARLFSDISGLENTAAPAQWQLLDEMGIPSLMLGEEQGGFGGGWQDAVLVARLLGYHGIAQPLVETMLARFALQPAGHTDVGGPMTIAHSDTANLAARGTCHTITAQLRNVPWGQDILVALTGEHESAYFVALLDPADAAVQHCRYNLAQEARADLLLAAAPLRALHWTANPLNLHHLAALLRSAQMAGAMQRMVALSVQYAGERRQFGRPISQFQVIQHSIAQLAEHSAAVLCAVEAAARALDCEGNSSDALFEIAAAKLRANLAVPHATSIAHQVHGAIGITREYQLHRFTSRLLAWRTEFGNDREWAHLLGQWCLDAQGSGLWQAITARGDRHMNIANDCSARAAR